MGEYRNRRGRLSFFYKFFMAIGLDFRGVAGGSYDNRMLSV